MKTLLILLLVLSPVPALALPVQFSLAGLMADGGSITGSLSYDTDEAPLAVNVRNLSGNAAYALTDYSITVNPLLASLQPVTYTPSVGNVELCLGRCVFASPDVGNLRFMDGLHTLQLTFTGMTDLTQWGTLTQGSSEYRSLQPNGIDQVVMVVRSAEMTAVPVPEPAVWPFMILGIGSLLLLSRRSV